MSTLESSSLAGSAPSEQPSEQAIANLIYDFGFVAEGLELPKFAELKRSYLWLASALPGLLATARDGERMDVLDEALDDFHWRHVPVADGGIETVAVIDWFFGDGDSSTTTSGATIREAVDTLLELIAADKPDDPDDAARSTGSVDNG